METVKKCQLCDMKTSSMKFLLRHLTTIHSNRPDFSFSCELNGCQRTFHNITTYKHHVYARHSKDHTNLHFINNPVNSEADDSDSGSDDFGGVNDDNPSSSSNIDEVEETATLEDITKAAAAWILKTKERHKIPQCAIKTIIEDVTSLFQTCIFRIFDAVKQQLSNLDIEEDVISLLSPLFDPNGDYGNPFKGLETDHMQLKYFKRNFGLIEPETIVLGTERKMRGSGQKRRCVEVRDEMKYIPLLSTLERLLQNKKLIQEIEKGHKSNDLVMKDYCDGRHFSSHPLNTIASHWIQIFLYFDELELCNPLGSRRTIHKIGAFYFTLGNCSPKFRSKLKSIQLFALIKNSLIKKYGMNAVLKPMIEDLKVLENGYTFIVSGSPRLFYGTLCVVSADNPASCALGGFKESTSAFLPCRQCLATKDEIKSSFHTSDFVLRTPQSHEEHLQILEDPNENYNSRSKEFGVNRRSLLMELKYFNVISGSMVPDVMHDVLEGVLQYESKIMLKQFINQDHYFTLAQLNQQIEAFELGFSEVKSRPSPISHSTLQEGDSHLKQSASQMWLLGRLLPQMIGHWIPRENEHWLSYLLLLEIVDILFAPDVIEEDISLLSVLIQDHHNDFVVLYPFVSVTPKMHFMIHMAQIMRCYGPLKQHWTMRYESKHSYFKRLANSLGNYINICHTLSIRHEQLQCYLRLSDSSYSMEIDIGPGTIIAKPSSFPAECSEVYRAKWVDICGTTYKKPCILVVECEDEFPVFGRLSSVYVLEDKNIIFLVQILHTHSFDPHFHSYRVTNTTNSKFVAYDDLISYTPLHERVICSQIFVTLKYRLPI